MRRAFTLIEVLVVVAIIGIMVTVAVVSVQEGREYAAMRGTVRTVFASIRQARSIALVTQKPAVITFSSKRTDEIVRSRIEITSAKIMEVKSGVKARSVTGEWIVLGDEDAPLPPGPPTAHGVEEVPQPGAKDGQTMEDILFEPVSEEVLEGVCIKVVMADEEFESPFSKVDEVKRSKISVFSNVDFLMDRFSRQRKEAESQKAESQKAEARKEKSAAEEVLPVDTEDVEAEKSVAWQTNGRCDAHTIYIYPAGEDVNNAWVIKVDRFGGVKVLEDGED